MEEGREEADRKKVDIKEYNHPDYGRR